ncbi:hypothetical protein K7640_10880 [Micromonospora sp. PLK6-60]|uniref:hypothetical protein n=1 Tax=Micromonospora sp. PLK6-60 TaxID=2873383 RepID=UPI001CA627E0|nr:hypothetical protein [Micromonospora sp. PLK6-60]MBY8872343.1 hypothetical protein [Micromonospora sp. PLK6-60]
MTDQPQPGQEPPAQPNPAPPVPPHLEPAKVASDKLKDGLAFLGGGLVLLVLGCGVGYLATGHDFPGVKFVGFLILVLLAFGAIGVLLGIFWTIQGTFKVIKARGQDR